MAEIRPRRVSPVGESEPHRRQIAELVNELSTDKIGAVDVDIPDDDVVSVTPPRRGGFLYIVVNANTSGPSHAFSGLLYYDIGSSLRIEKNTGWATTSTNVDVSTSDVTGTTGTDGNITVAVQADEVKIENRAGSDANFRLIFI